MEFLKDVHSVRLLGYKGRFLWADDDRRSVAQKKGQDSYGVIWRVELVPGKNAIRLKSVYDLYLMASDYPFLLGATGKKVMQSIDARSENVEWEPIHAGFFVKFRTKGDKFLRANGGVPPYRNSVTHDVPVLASNQHVVLWEVEVVKKKSATPAAAAAPSPKQSVPPKSQGPESTYDPESSVPPPFYTRRAPSPPQGPESTHDPESSVPPPLYTRRARPRRHSAPTEIDFPSESSSPTSERLSPIASPPRQRQYSPPPSQSAGNTPRRPRRAPLPSTSDDDAPLQRRRAPLRHASVPEVPSRFVPRRDEDDDTSSGSEESPKMSEHRLIDETWPGISPRVKSPSDFRRIFYTVAEDNGEVLAHDDDTFGSFLFKGHTLQELTEALQLETGIDEDVILCMKNPLTNKLYKMRLQLPPNKAPLSVVLVRHNTEFGRTLSLSGARR